MGIFLLTVFPNYILTAICKPPATNHIAPCLLLAPREGMNTKPSGAGDTEAPKYTVWSEQDQKLSQDLHWASLRLTLKLHHSDVLTCHQLRID